jgi:hypothetical protein
MMMEIGEEKMRALSSRTFALILLCKSNFNLLSCLCEVA